MLRPNLCIVCEACLKVCPEGAISVTGGVVTTDRSKCTICGKCVEVCTADARAIVGREMTVSEVMAELEKDTPFYDQSGGGVTFSGGEALLQPEFLLELLKSCKHKGLHTALDTSGAASWRVIGRVRLYVDLFLYDLKGLDDQAHRKFTGVSNRLILSNLKRLSELGHNIVLRVPLIPGVNDSPEAIAAIGSFAVSLPHLVGLEVLPYHQAGVEKYRRLEKAYALAGIPSPSKEKIESIAEVLRNYSLNIQVGG